MKEIPLTKGKIALVDDTDYDWLIQWKWHAWTAKGKWFAISQEKEGHKMKMHRLIMNAPDGLQVDHRNHNGLDNRRENLRICTNTENSRNRRIRRDNTTGFKGVHWLRR